MINPHHNHLGQPVGYPMPDWKGAPRPPRSAMNGRYCRVEPISVEKHAHDLYAANALIKDDSDWTYLSCGPFTSLDEYLTWMRATCLTDDPLFHAIIDGDTGKAVGVASYMRIDPKGGVIEVGHLKFSPPMQRTRVATEAMHLMMQRAFALGYRRYEWKCDSFNAPSRAAAQRYGFSYEGVFRQAVVYKGRSRDTAWYSIIDSEWPAIDTAFTRWLVPENFDAQGQQRVSLSDLTAPLLKARG